MDRRIRKNYSKWFLTRVKHAILDFNMIENGDRIAVGVSGGKDSITLLYILTLLKKWSNFKFELLPVSIDIGLDADYSSVRRFCQEEELPYHVEKTYISEIVFNIRQEKNPCSLCAKMRRGALHNTALRLKCNKIALGHHLDDAVETYFLNLFHTGKFATFEPKTYLTKTKLWLVRPMIYLPEEKINGVVQQESLPIVENPCPVSSNTERERIKEITSLIQSRFPHVKERFLNAFCSDNSFWGDIR